MKKLTKEALNVFKKQIYFPNGQVVVNAKFDQPMYLVSENCIINFHEKTAPKIKSKPDKEKP